MEPIYLILIALVVLFGLGVLVVSRRRGSAPSGGGRARVSPPPTMPPRLPSGGVGTLEDESVVVDEAAVVRPSPPTLRERLSRARAGFANTIGSVLGRTGITDETWDDLEEGLLKADVGLSVSDELLAGLKERVKAKDLTEPQQVVDALRAEMAGRLAASDRSLAPIAGTPGNPDVWLFVGVNGVGKTTTIGKMAHQLMLDGHRVMMAAGDTFRAAAGEQLRTWSQRAGAELVRGAEGGDPSAIIFDAVESAASKGIPIVLADTAGRLHTKTNLMEELRKVRRVADRGRGTVKEVLLVIDATTGQNGLVQARQFSEATQVTGVVLTKLDGSAKGGIVFAIETELDIPVKLVGVGETIKDLVPFEPDEFVDALF